MELHRAGTRYGINILQRRKRVTRTSIGGLALVALCATGARAEVISISVLDERGQVTPVRMEIVDDVGGSHIPDSALPLYNECFPEPSPNQAPGCMAQAKPPLFLDNPHTGAREFYTGGSLEIELPPGRYSLTAYKGFDCGVSSGSS